MSQRAPGVEIAPELESAIVAGLSPRRNERYQTAEQFLARLRAVDLS